MALSKLEINAKRVQLSLLCVRHVQTRSLHNHPSSVLAGLVSDLHLVWKKPLPTVAEAQNITRSDKVLIYSLLLLLTSRN